MGWTDFTRRRYVRRTGRYATGLTDWEWSLIAAYAATTQARPTAQDGVARGFERTALYCIDRLPTANVAEGFSCFRILAASSSPSKTRPSLSPTLSQRD
jgi:hypothetical protein